MSRRRFYVPPESFTDESETVLLSSDEARHLRDVLRLERGAEVFAFDGLGREYRCTVEESGRRANVSLRVLEEVGPMRPESPLHLELAVSLLKGEKFDLVVQKATELGVTAILPVMTKQSDVRLRDAGEARGRVARWWRIALEAAKQSGRAFVPSIAAPVAFASMSEAKASEGWRLMFTERGGDALAEVLKDAPAGLMKATALVGPEGGWTDEELASASGAGWRLVTLGGRTLRAETAAIAVAVLLQHLFGDLK